MGFNPRVMDVATVKRLAKRLRKALVLTDLSVDLPLTVAQDVLAQTLGYLDWRDFLMNRASISDQTYRKGRPLIGNLRGRRSCGLYWRSMAKKARPVTTDLLHPSRNSLLWRLARQGQPSPDGAGVITTTQVSRSI